MNERPVRVVEGVFHWRNHNHGFRWEFQEGSGDMLFVDCAFVPTCRVFVYTLEVAWIEKPENSFYVVREVSEIKQRPWCMDIAMMFNKGLQYKEGESFEACMKRTGEPVIQSDETVLWKNAPLLCALADGHDCSLSDDAFIETMVKQQYMWSYESPYMVIPHTVKDSALAALVYEMKLAMVRYRTWVVPDQMLSHLQFCNGAASDVFPEAPFLVRDSVNRTMAFKTDKTARLRQDEPVDEYVHRMIKWTNEPCAEREVQFLPLVEKDKNAVNKKAMRYHVDGADVEMIQAFVAQREVKRCVMVFPSRARTSKRAFLDIACRLPTRAYYKDGNPGRLFWTIPETVKKKDGTVVPKPFNGMYQLQPPGGEPPFSVSAASLYTFYRSAQTLHIDQIKHLADAEFDAVVLFSSYSLPRRWIAWCDRCVGPSRVMLLVGHVGSYY
jgi:hypothetical protein